MNINQYKNKYLSKRVVLTSTNYNGEKGIVDEVIYPNSNPSAFFGVEVKIKLDSGLIVTAYKSEDFQLDNY